MPVAVITGCNSGIGHAFANILCDEGYKVFATDAIVGDKLKALKRAAVSELDVTSTASINAFKDKVGDEAIDVLLNIAGIMAPKEQDSLEATNHSVLEKTFAVNTYGPLLLTQALLPNLLKSSSPRVGNMANAIQSSRVGSIADNSSGGSYAYRASKAALNSISKSMAMDLKDKGVVVVMMHPGYVISGLDTSGHTASLPEAVQPQEAASKLWKVFMSKKKEHTGSFWHREGQELPW